MAKRSSIRVDDRRLRRLKADLARLPSARVGILSSSKERTGDDATNALIGAVHELGAGVPRRSWLRDYVHEHAQAIRAGLREAVRDIAAGGAARQAFGRLAAKHVGGIQKRIAARIPPPLSESTIDRKGSDVPLIDSGQFRSSITWDVDGDR